MNGEDHAEPAPLAAGLNRALERAGLPAARALERLSGGANMESWRFDGAAGPHVLRRAPSAAMMAGRPLDHAGEAALIRAVREAGVLAPEVVAELAPEDRIGTGFVMRAVAGSADPAPILALPDPGALLGEIARELAAIHAVAPAALPELPALDPAGGLAELRGRFLAYGGDRPILALALRWLEQNLPSPTAPRLVHGDFRLGNLMVAAGRLSGVLDWELAHLGDPHEDLAYGCMTVWRFTRPDRPAFGLGAVEQWLEAYRAAGGIAVEPARFRFWLVYRTLWWALGCLQMGAIWREGVDRSVERVVVARRTCEQELDLLLLLEEEAPAAERARPLPPGAPTRAALVGEPDAAELLDAVSEWLGREIKPQLAGRARFDLAVARNALGIAARELGGARQPADGPLAAALLDGRTDLAEPGLLARLRRAALDKVAADMPKYPALALARARWEGS